ncbi:MAG: YihY/virulence factor BrkB family protein [Nocardioidaceae bacterium]|nr:YihY/virulence factor BrkB family protein [Nocardioidaceae bacterium]
MPGVDVGYEGNMAADPQSMGDKIKARIAQVRQRSPLADHLMRMVEHYGKVEGNLLAGAVTYFGFLSFFPILALGFAVIGYVSIAYPGARDSLITAIESIFPGIVSPTQEDGKISLADIEKAKAAAGVIGFVGVLYSGLNWLSGLRTALQDVFVIPEAKVRNFVVGKALDLLVLAILGAVLIVSVGLSGVAQGITDKILDFVGLSSGGIGAVLVWVIGFALGLAASTLLLYVMFRLLGEPRVGNGALWQGALLGAAGFEVLKLLVIYVLGGVGGSAFAPLAIAITLVVWINYFSRLILYGASWAFTSDPLTATQVATSEADVLLGAGGAEHRTLATRARPATDTGAGSVTGPPEDEPEPSRGKFDPGSAVVGAAVGAVVAHLLRERD